MEAGRRLRAPDLGILASVGLARVPVFRPLKVALLSTGDELLEPGEASRPGLLYNSNRHLLLGLLDNLGLVAVDGGRVEDSPEALTAQLSRLAEDCDCVISTGGVSVGDRDYLRPVLSQIGSIDLWGLAIKPGKPLAFGHVGATPIFALPGNPAAVLVTFCVLVRPCLLKLQGAQQARSVDMDAVADFSHPGSRREEYLRAGLYRAEDGELRVRSAAAQGSGILSTASQADCLAVVKANTAVTAGDRVRIVLLAEQF